MGSKVPKFGAWEGAQGAENFTVYFDSARKTKHNGQKINPNDPEENPDLFPQYAGSSQAQPKPESSPPRVAEPRPQAQGRGRARDQAPVRPVNPAPQAQAPVRPVNPASQAQAPVRPVNPAPQGGRAKVPQFGAWNGEEGTQYTAYFEVARKNKNEGGEPAMNRDVIDKVRAPPVTKEPAANREASDRVRVPPVTKVRAEPPKEDAARNVSRGSTSSDSLGKQSSVPKATAQPKANPRHQAAAGVPQFGAWNNTANASQPEGYTVAFARAKEDKRTPLHASAQPSYNQPPPQNNQNHGSCCTIL